MDRRSIKPAACPRCGYDLRGAVAEWTDACPLAGRCNECGLDFEWGDIFKPDRFGPRWCVEFAHRRALLLATARTWGRSLLPPRLFGALKLWHEIRPRRLVLYAITLFLIGYAIVCGLQGWHAYRGWRQTAGYGYPMSVSAPRYVGHAIMMPFSRNSVGTVTFPPRGAWVGSTSYAGSVFPLASPRDKLQGLPMRLFVSGAAIVGAVPFTFLLLPISVRRAKVRPGHLARITVYSVGWVFVMFLVFAVGFLPRYQPPGWLLLTFVTPLAMPVALFLTWHAAIRHYLRMPHATAVTAATITIAVLAVVLALTVFSPAFLFREIMDF